MTFGRAITFAAILAVSLGLSTILVGRHRRPGAVLTPHPHVARRAPRPARSAPPAPAGARPEASEAVDVIEDPLSAIVCPEEMLLVEGVTCAETHRKCLERQQGPDSACRAYAPAVCRKGMKLRFCIDRYEYPNREGMLPAAVVTFEQARSACEEESKRLCTEMEWSFACEGPKGLAFSYGDEEIPGVCNVGRPAPRLATTAFWEPRDVAEAVERYDARVKAGAMGGCVGPFGARDLIGNVEEWVRSDDPGFERALRGGKYTGTPTCRAVRQIKQPSFRQLQTGFRCCRDPLPLPRHDSP